MQHSTVRITTETKPGAKFLPPPGSPTIPCHGDPPQLDVDPNRLLSLLLDAPAPPAGMKSSRIPASLREIVLSFRFDGCGLMALAREKSEARAIHYCNGDGEEAAPEPIVLAETFPWTRQNLLNGNIVCFSSPAQLPDPAAVDRQSYQSAGIKAFLAIPIYVGRSVEYYLVAHRLASGEHWRKDQISLLRLIGELLVIGLDRCRDRGGSEPPLPFEQLVYDISHRMINLTERNVDREIGRALDLVRKMLEFDRFGLMTFSPESGEVRVTHASYGEGVIPFPEQKEISRLFPWAKENLLAGEVVRFSSLDELPEAAAVDRQSWQALGVKGNLTLPIRVAGSLEYLLVASDFRASHCVEARLLPTMHLLGELFANALVRCRGELAQQKARTELRRLEEKLQSEAESLQLERVCSQRHEEIIGESGQLAKTLAQIEQVAPTGSTVLICGETGTGKELVARAIHKLGTRRNKPMVTVNCASLPAALVESELFGREKGAYTGALTRQAGRFELADGGTIFLDEIAEMSLELQAKLLRVLQEGQFERLGSVKTTRVDVRVIAATNRNLAEDVKKGNFREDLYYRLNVFQIVVPPLRERSEDIPLLVWSFVNEFGEKMGKKINRISKQDMASLQRYPWPGNVRELRNVVEHAVIVSSGNRLLVRLPEDSYQEMHGIRTLQEYEAMHIREALRLTGWRIKGEGGAAKLLGLNPSTLYSRMQKLGVGSPPPRDDISPRG